MEISLKFLIDKYGEKRGKRIYRVLTERNGETYRKVKEK